MNNLYNPAHNYVEINADLAKNQFVKAGGAAGWLDTDVSGSDIPADAIAVQWKCEGAASQNMGVRRNGSPNVNACVVNTATQYVSAGPDSSFHLAFYREAAQNTYKALGYWI